VTGVVRSYDAPPYPVYVVTGAAGNTEGLTSYTDAPATAWSRYVDGSDYGISSVTFNSPTELVWRTLRSSDGAVIDSFTLTRGAHDGARAVTLG
jgi:hypothetical protein